MRLKLLYRKNYGNLSEQIQHFKGRQDQRAWMNFEDAAMLSYKHFNRMT